MRHIPEEELHAYLDQALSRTQCVEIESHLAGCSRCHDVRNEIAALRDRTTALLARIGPATTLPPSFDIIRRRHALAAVRRRRLVVRGAWAASLLVGVALGWQGNQWLNPETAKRPATAVPLATPLATAIPRQSRPESLVASRPATTPVSIAAAAPPRAKPRAPRHSAGSQPVLATAAPSKDSSDGMITSFVPAGDGREQASLDVSALNPAGWQIKPELDGLWRTLPLDEGNEMAKARVPLVSGVPVVQVQVQRRNAEEEVTAVDQQLASGEFIRTIEGPVLQVSDLMTKLGGATPPAEAGSDSATAVSSSPLHPDATLTLRQGDRMVVVTGPSSVVHSLMSRVQVRGWR